MRFAHPGRGDSGRKVTTNSARKLGRRSTSWPNTSSGAGGGATPLRAAPERPPIPAAKHVKAAEFGDKLDVGAKALASRARFRSARGAGPVDHSLVLCLGRLPLLQLNGLLS